MMHFKNHVLIIICFIAVLDCFSKNYETKFQIFESKKSILELCNQQENFVESEWINVEKNVNLGFKDGILVVKLEFNDELSDFFLTVENAHLDSVILCIYEEGVMKRQELNGDLMPFNNRVIKSNYPTFRITEKAKSIYFFVKSKGLLAVPITIKNTESYLENQRRTEKTYWIFTGFCATVFFVSILFGILLSEKLHLLFSIYALGAFISIIHDYGYTFELFWPNLWKINHYNASIYGILSFVIFYFIGQVILNANSHKSIKYLFSFLIISSLTTIFINLIGFYNIAIQFYSYILLPNILLVYAMIFYTALKNHEIYIKIILVGFSIYLVFIVLYTLATLDIFEYSEFWSTLYMIGIGVQIFFFFIAVTFKVYKLKQETIVQKEQLLNLYEQNRIILEHQNQLLEERVKERTQKLIETTEEVMAQNEELHAQRSELEATNNDLNEKGLLILELNEKLKIQNQDLESSIEKRTKEIKMAYEELKDKNSRLEQFAYVTSHNLRGPIATILGLSQLFEISDEAQKVELRKKIKETASKLDTVIKGLNNVLDIRKNLNNNSEMIHFESVLNDVKVMLQNEIVSSQAVITLNLNGIEKVWGISVYMNNILYNLINNSIKYRKPQIKPEINITLKEKEGCHEIELKDNGIGIDLISNKDKLFHPFKRFHEFVEGTGLGLYIIKTQTEAMKGKIEVESEVGIGTTFRILLPKQNV
ncbi:MAG: ATP-binding protein [Cytophagales bacterium]